MSPQDEIKALAIGLGFGENLGGQLCPFCCGGRNKERSLSLVNVGDSVLWICHRAQCGSTGSTAPRTGKSGAGSFSVTISKPTKKEFTPRFYQGTFEELPDVIFEYYLARYAGFTERSLREACRWSPEYQRTIWPVTSPTGALRGVELRSHRAEDRPKTLHYRYSADPWAGHYRGSPGAGYGSAGVVALVEDVISAYRVAQSGIDAVSLMGTNLSLDKFLDVVTNNYGKTIVLCLDKDATTKALAYKDRYDFVCPIEVRFLERDMKYLTDNQIRVTLSTGFL